VCPGDGWHHCSLCGAVDPSDAAVVRRSVRYKGCWFPRRSFAALNEKVNKKIDEFADRGLRALGIALADGDGNDGNTKWRMLALVPMEDPPRSDTKATIEYCRDQVRALRGQFDLLRREGPPGQPEAGSSGARA
jgi:hypothetical protein